jgi:L-ascorbate metabolism protein UlaG (beta-lactamase superfamily)
MELQYFGANGLKFTTKKSVIVVDPQSDITKQTKIDLKKADTVLITQDPFLPSDVKDTFVVNGPGEYEFEDYSVKGIPAQAHTAPFGDKSATVYWIGSHDLRVLVVGHIDAKLTEEQLESIGTVDVAIVPVGGSGYTLDAVGAASVVRAIEPKVVIPVHSADDGLQYDVPQQELDLFVKELGAPVAEEKVEKYKFKTLPEQLTIQIITKQ